MEALLFILNSVLMVVLAYMALRDDRRPPGTPATNPFRMADDSVSRPSRAEVDARQVRLARSRGA